MSSKDSMGNAPESKGMFQRMLKLVTSPKHAESGYGTDSLGTEEKTQMLIRKQRNDLARRREFEELRQLHRQRLLNEDNSRASALGGDMSKSSTRQIETLNKINQLESQMASRWSQQQETRALAEKSARAAAGSSAAGQGQAAAQGQSLLSDSSSALSVVDATPQVDDAQQLAELADPALEEVGVLFASNEDEQVEQNLRSMLDKNSPQRNKRATWLILMDFYRAVGNQAAFETVAMEYMTLFAESAPQWHVFDPVVVMKMQANSASNGESVYWVCPAVLDAAAALTMQEQFNVDDDKVVRIIDSSAVKDMTAEAAEIVLNTLQRCDRPGVTLQITGGSALMSVLGTKTKNSADHSNQVFWTLRLELLRLFKTAEEFDVEAMEFCLAHEVSPPAWVEPKCASEDLDLTNDDEQDEDEDYTTGRNSTMIGSPSTDFYGQNVKAPLRLRGALKGNIGKVLKDLDTKIPEDGGFLQINCERLVRMDFAAAGDLLNWVSEKSAKGFSVQLIKVNRLVALFFIVMGISVSARLSIRRD